MKSVCAIFSCERFAGLVNAAASIRRHFPTMDILVVDDGSSDPRIAAYCKDQVSKGHVVDFHVRTGAKPTGGRVGSLYENMQYALDWALQRGYDLMLTMQDDMQCLWGEEQILNDVARFFENCENAIFLQSRFCKRAVYHDQYRYNEDLDAYRIRRGCNAVGFYYVVRIRATEFGFGANERESSENADRLGFLGYQMACPILADIPLEARNAREFVLQESGFRFSDSPDAAVPVLNDLGRNDIEHLRARDRKIPPFGEDYICRENSAGLIFPHWFARNAPERYVEVLTTTYKLERRSKAAPLLTSNESATDSFGKRPAPAKKLGVLRNCWRQATRRYRYVSIADYIIRKTRLFLFFYFQYGRMQKWFAGSSRNLSDG